MVCFIKNGLGNQSRTVNMLKHSEGRPQMTAKCTKCEIGLKHAEEEDGGVLQMVTSGEEN